MKEKLKKALVAWVTDYLVITGILWALNPWLNKMPLALRTIPLTLIMVGLIQFVVMPLTEKYLKNWLTK